MPIGGAVLLLLSVPVFSRRPVRAVMAETLALLGVIAAGEILWLAPALVVVYAAWILDYQLARSQATERPESMRTRPPPSGHTSTRCLRLPCAAVIGVKLVGHGFPNHYF